MHRFSLLTLLALVAFGLAACAEPIDSPPADEVAEEAAEAPPAANTDVTVDGTIAALEGGITNLAPTAALANIDGWIAQLSGVEFDERDDILEGLGDLRTALTATPLDGSAIGQILESLGEDTSEAGSEADNATVTRLGELLSQAGEQLDDM